MVLRYIIERIPYFFNTLYYQAPNYRMSRFYFVCAVFILALKYLQNYHPDTDVYTIIPKEWIIVLQQKLGVKFPVKTVRDFYIGVAKLGGYFNRKNDAPPGWKRIWKGFNKLLPLVDGYKLALEIFPEKIVYR